MNPDPGACHYPQPGAVDSHVYRCEPPPVSEKQAGEGRHPESPAKAPHPAHPQSHGKPGAQIHAHSPPGQADQGVPRRRTASGVLLQHPHHQLPKRRRGGGEFPAGRGRLLVEMGRRHGDLGGAAEGGLARDHLPGGSSGRVDVRGGTDRYVSSNLLRGGVFGGSDEAADRRQGRAFHLPRQAEIDEHHALARPLPGDEKDIRRLDVPVDDAGLVGGRQGLEEPPENRHHRSRVQAAAALEPLLESLSVEEIGDQIEQPPFLSDVMNAQDARVMQFPNEPQFPAQTLEGRPAPPGEEDLERDLLPRDLVAGPEDLPRPSVPDRGEDPVASREQLSRLEVSEPEDLLPLSGRDVPRLVVGPPRSQSPPPESSSLRP